MNAAPGEKRAYSRSGESKEETLCKHLADQAAAPEVADLRRNYPLGVGVRERVEQDVIDNAEDGCRGADAES
jgi:hypothetical protein